jgi:BirA family transcriptional regulator, biotin operon repressor / biotin---[acetyl-CoA-carboxylase] ligase
LPDPSPLPSDLAAALARARPRLGAIGSTVLHFPVTGSTNDVAVALAARAGDREGTVVVADEQTAGRGRRGRAWFSPAGSGLYVSIVLTPGRARHQPGRATLLLTLAAGVAVAEGVHLATAVPVDLKWPNDVFLGRRKIAGILAEAAATEQVPQPVVLGYGINVSPAAYPLELRDRATSLETEAGRPVDRTLVLVETLAAMARRYDDLLNGRFDAILDAWRLRAPSAVGARVTWAGARGPVAGVTAGVDEDGALRVDVDGRVERIAAGEITWL